MKQATATTAAMMLVAVITCLPADPVYGTGPVGVETLLRALTLEPDLILLVTVEGGA